jgi:hypothetical protein
VLRATAAPHKRCGFTADERVNGDTAVKQMPCTLHSCRDKIIRHSPSLASVRQNERVQAALGDGSLSRPALALIFLPTDISLSRRRKYVQLRGYVDDDITDVTGATSTSTGWYPLSSSTLLSTKFHFCAICPNQSVKKKIRILHGNGSSKQYRIFMKLMRYLKISVYKVLSLRLPIASKHNLGALSVCINPLHAQFIAQ